MRNVVRTEPDPALFRCRLTSSCGRRRPPSPEASGSQLEGQRVVNGLPAADQLGLACVPATRAAGPGCCSSRTWTPVGARVMEDQQVADLQRGRQLAGQHGASLALG